MKPVTLYRPASVAEATQDRCDASLVAELLADAKGLFGERTPVLVAQVPIAAALQ